MKILLVNPNVYRTPPVPPLALSHLYSALKNTNHECEILDLCFSDNPSSALEEEITRFNPDIAGFTLRNIDTVIYQNNIFFLDDIKQLIETVRNHGIPVILGGAGFSFIPEGILDYTGADWGIKGPGEQALGYFLDRIGEQKPPKGAVLDGWKIGIDKDFTVYRDDGIDYERYISERGIPGFQTQKGCTGRCSYCKEGNDRIFFRNPECVVAEIRSLYDRGFNSFHLCDTEFNQDLGHCKAFLQTLIRNGPEISWALYMKSSPYDEEHIRLLKNSGVDLITLSLPTGNDCLEHAGELRHLAQKHGIKLAIDLLVGFPGETVETVTRTIETLRNIKPATVGVNSAFRLSPGLEITREIEQSPVHQQYLLGATEDNPHYILPVFYQHITVEMLRDIIGDDPLFKIEGTERTSNYERV